jgi:hydroxymethylglutaryl-CoA reductase (NADPH)
LSKADELASFIDFIRTTPQLVPRLGTTAYQQDAIGKRRGWVEQKTASRLTHIGSYSIPSEQMRGNIENAIGAVQIPLGIAGPLVIHGNHAKGIFYVPLATTEGALVRSYERGMVTLTRAGGVTTRVHQDENRVSPVFFLSDVAAAHEFTGQLTAIFARIKEEAESTTEHGKLLRLESHPIGREVIVNFCYYTADAHGMNMIVKATERACQWILSNTCAQRFYLFSGLSSEKRASGALLGGGKGKKVTAGAVLSPALLKDYLHTSPAQLLDLWHHSVVGHMQANAIGYNAHYANGLTALFIACGQDVANVANSSVGITNFEVLEDGEVYVSVTLPSLTVATVGGGTGLGTSYECLQMLGVAGKAGAPKLAEIAAATLLAGEISMAAAIASGEFAQAHDKYGRNRPEPRTEV